MKVTYTGGQGELTSAQRNKLETRFQKLGKMLDGKGEKEARVILTAEKRDKKAEITVNFLHHSLVGVCKGPEYLPALSGAIDKLEKQVVKIRAKVREKSRNGMKIGVVAAAAEAPKAREAQARIRVVRPASRAAVTAREAAAMMKKNSVYLAFNDVETGSVSVLVRCGDGIFDLVQS